MFCKKGVLKSFAKFTDRHLCRRLFLKRIFRNTYFYITPPVTASVAFRALFSNDLSTSILFCHTVTLNHLFSMHRLSFPWKRQGQRKGALGIIFAFWGFKYLALLRDQFFTKNPRTIASELSFQGNAVDRIRVP